MGKKKSKKSKKKPQKKQKKQQKEEKNDLPEVSKELYEIQISDLNSKLQRATQQFVELEKENAQIRENLIHENEDRADVIIYLKRVLKSKSQDIVELKEQVTTLRQARELENFQFSEQLSNEEKEKKKLQEQLSTEINLLSGKLNVLDEFRLQKEELTKKFEIQDEAQKLQELRHQEMLHTVEKDFLLKKIQMKREMEERLIQLSEDFQSIIQSKIDSTTRAIASENNSLKTEMKKLINTSEDLIKENNDLKSRERRLKIKCALLKEELHNSIRKYINANKKVQQAVHENEELRSEVRTDVSDYLAQIEKLSDNLDEYKVNLRKQIEVNHELEKEVSFYQNQERSLHERLQFSINRIEHIESVINKAAQVIREILSNEHAECKIDQIYRTRFTMCLLEILKTAEIDEKQKLFRT